MLKPITLDLAERQLVNVFLLRCTEGTATAASIYRSLRQDLQLRAASKVVNEMVDEAKEIAAIKCETCGKALDEEGTRKVDWPEIAEKEKPKEYTIDVEVLRWLQTKLQVYNWGKKKERDKDGKEIEIDVPIDPSMMEILANLNDAINEAMAHKTETDDGTPQPRKTSRMRGTGQGERAS